MTVAVPSPSRDRAVPFLSNTICYASLGVLMRPASPSVLCPFLTVLKRLINLLINFLKRRINFLTVIFLAVKHSIKFFKWVANHLAFWSYRLFRFHLCLIINVFQIHSNIEFYHFNNAVLKFLQELKNELLYKFHSWLSYIEHLILDLILVKINSYFREKRPYASNKNL